jgi:hypothetical protein
MIITTFGGLASGRALALAKVSKQPLAKMRAARRQNNLMEGSSITRRVTGFARG